MSERLALLLASLRGAGRDRSDLVTESLLLRHQLAVLTRPTRRTPRLRTRDRLLWVLARRLRPDWRRHLVLVRPETVVRWHRHAWRLFWRWRSQTHLGRPRLSMEVRELIGRMSQDNPLWGSERIRGELLKLGIIVSRRSIRRYRWQPPGRPSQTWRTFLRNHAQTTWAADLFTVQTLTFRALYVLLLITHGRRELVHVNVTAHPTAAWVWRQLVEATAWGRRPRPLIRDGDRVFGSDLHHRKALDIDTLLIPARAPRANAIAERVIGTLRWECRDHLPVLNEQHLRAVLAECVANDNRDRPHRTLRLDTPRPASRSPTGPVRVGRVLGGLHHVYERTA